MFITCCATLSAVFAVLRACFLSNLVMASSKHLAISRSPTTEPVESTTGRCRKWFSTIVVKASIAESVKATHVGFCVIISDKRVTLGSTNFATTRRVMSVSVTMPANAPFSFTTTQAFPLLAASIFAMEDIV